MLQLYFRYKMQNKFVLTRYFKYKITELPAEYRAHRLISETMRMLLS